MRMDKLRFMGNERLNPIKETLSDVIHSCMVEVLQFLSDKRFHCFFLYKLQDYINRGNK